MGISYANRILPDAVHSEDAQSVGPRSRRGGRKIQRLFEARGWLTDGPLPSILPGDCLEMSLRRILSVAFGA